MIEVPPKIGIAIGSTLLTIGVVIIGFKAEALMLGFRSLKWPQITALVSDAKYWTSASLSSGGGSHVTHHGMHQYTFSVDGRTYQGSNFDVAGAMNTGLESRANHIQSIVRKGAQVPVFYDPEDPARCVLKPGIAEDTQVALVFFALFSCVGAIVLRYQINRLRNAHSEPTQQAS